MEGLKKSIKLYSLMRDRCASSGFCNNQAQVYSEMIDFIAACESVEDSMQKIRNSKYYLAPSAALLKDKLEAEKKFAIENNMQDLVDVYSSKINAINEDIQNMYVDDYASKAQNIKSAYINSLTAFGNVFVSYVSYICSGDDAHVSDIKKHIAYIKYPNSNFAEVSKLENFRKLIPLADKAYGDFVGSVIEIVNGGSIASFADMANAENYDVEAEFSKLSDNVDALRAKGEKWLNVSFENTHTAFAPKYEKGLDVSNLKYKYEEK